MDLVQHIERQREFSLRTFGPGERTEGVIAHIRQELEEVRENPYDIFEWIDIVILAIDGAWRAGFEPEQIAAALVEKQAANEKRRWPRWDEIPAGQPINHIREPED
jgi:hypothetical protein